MNNVYSKKNFHIYRIENDFIVHNTNKEFKKGHTHLESFKCSKYLIDLAIYKDIPHDLDIYRLTSLIRISEDEEYIRKLNELINVKKERKKSDNCPYYNSKNYRNNSRRR